MIMIQDDPMPTGADKPLRITGDPHKVQVGLAWCAPPSFRFTLDFTHFMPSIFHFNLNASVFSDKTQAGLLLLFFLCRSHHCNLIAVSFIASPGTCGEAHPRQGPRRLQGWQGRLRIQNGGKQSGCKMGCFVFSSPFFKYSATIMLLIYLSTLVSCHSGGRAQVCCRHHHRQERRDDQEDSERRWCQNPVQTRLGACLKV